MDDAKNEGACGASASDAVLGTNPNNCGTCDYTKLNGNREGHCYMFRDTPDTVCAKHTMSRDRLLLDARQQLDEIAERRHERDRRLGLVPNACGEPGLTDTGKD